MPISERLRAVASFIAFPSLADIGTDHAYLPVYALERGLADAAIACDISPGSLAKAEKNIAGSAFRRKIQTRLGDGLKPITPGEVQCAVLAGMGGHLIMDILRGSPEVTGGLSQVILQPQNDAAFVRRAAHEMDLRIEGEKIVYENGKYYNILDCRPRESTGGREGLYTDAGYEFGQILIDNKDLILMEYINKIIQKSELILAKIRTGGANMESAQVLELQRVICLAKETQSRLRA
ncbi:MAG: class I SAM-dependent methyltransferase [Defluviitaleaceae bacterium]|nr:class I SAM-dependent methyltransferase [Defluviitaleaceae bacterium]